MKTEHIPNKHLTYEERNFIEIGLNNGRNFAQIANDLNKSRTTIMREVQGHKFRKNPSGFNNSKNLCKNRHECKKFNCTKKEKCYEEEICLKLTGAPYVCNGCEQKNKCRKIKYYYYSKLANDEYSEKLRTSRINRIDINSELRNTLSEHFGENLNIYTDQDLYEQSRKIIQNYKDNYTNKYKKY